MVYISITLSLIGFGLIMRWGLNGYEDKHFFAAITSLMFMVFISIANFINVPLEHTVVETSNLLKHEELSLQYAICEDEQNINCAAIIKDVVKFNSDLRAYKHYNKIFDLYYSDEVAALPLIGGEQ